MLQIILLYTFKSFGQSLKSTLNIVRGIKVSLANIFCSFSYDSKVNVKKAISLITEQNTATCLRVAFFFYIYLPSLHNLRRDFSYVTFYRGRKATNTEIFPSSFLNLSSVPKNSVISTQGNSCKVCICNHFE